jgi:hypothetical protein
MRRARPCTFDLFRAAGAVPSPSPARFERGMESFCAIPNAPCKEIDIWQCRASCDAFLRSPLEIAWNQALLGPPLPCHSQTFGPKLFSYLSRLRGRAARRTSQDCLSLGRFVLRAAKSAVGLTIPGVAVVVTPAFRSNCCQHPSPSASVKREGHEFHSCR